MNITAAIPARAGSVGIPNKNTRIVAGHPLIVYAIENALNSKYINKVIVISDSEEIEMIAESYDVVFKKEDDNLRAGSITLDEVVCSALEDEDLDYSVTLQPTSPTLKVETLDAAIEFAIENDYDTVLSAVNRPKLGWIIKNGKLVPDYEKRLNRQYLPKHYMETGSFVICKQYVLDRKTRFGDSVSVYEVSDEEAFDIDGFNDLICAENILTKKNIAIMVNGNNSIGMGHIYRMLDLADMFYTKPVFFYDENLTERSAFGNTTYELQSFSNRRELLNMLDWGNYDIVINDILDTDKDYITEIKSISSEPKVVNFEDNGSGRYAADLVVNALYSGDNPEYAIYSGEEYYIVPKSFTFFNEIQIKNNVNSVFICFGGADPRNYTEMVMDLIGQDEFRHLSFHVVIGRAKKNVNELLCRASENLHIYYDIKCMPKIMSQCDVAITSRGRTCFELAYLGIPTLSIAQNDKEMMHSFVIEENGFLSLDNHADYEEVKRNVSTLINLSYQKRLDMQSKLKRKDLSKGRNRVRDLILDL